MLIPESRHPREAARPIDPDAGAGIGAEAEPRESAAAPTVLRSSGSSVRRAQARAGSAIPLPAPGEMVGSFLLEEAIGAGGMGAVFRALDTQLDRQVALKLLPPDQAVDPEVVQRFYQEGRSAAQLDHENIARVFSIGQDGPNHYIAFEYIEGATLRHRVESAGPLKPGEAVDVALQIANALVHASRRGVVHRDIKPSNIILTPQGRAKVVDMGLARRFERGVDRGLTQSGMTLGTFDYISPEQARDPRDVDVRSDLYSLGCTMFHMLTGRPPFPGGTVLQKLIQHQEEAPADVRTLNPDVPAELSAVIAKLMAKERDRRYQGPEHLVRDLLALAGSLGVERGSTELEPWMLPAHQGWWERHLVWMLPALGFVVVISGLAWWGREFSRPSGPGHGPAEAVARRPAPELKIAEATGPASPPGEPGTAAGAAPAEATLYPTTIPVSSTEDLAAILASAPPRSVIVLGDDGPYRLSGRAWSARGTRPAGGVDLTIKAEAGVRPVLRRGEGHGAEEGRSPALLRFLGGHVVIEGVEFEVEADPAGEPAAAIRCEETELVLRGCSFRRPAGVGRGDRDAAILVRAAGPGAPGADRPPAVFADACHFDGGQAAVRAEGPADVTLRDCTIGPAGPSIWYDQTPTRRPVPGELRLVHTSILAGPGPVFRFDGGPVRARVDDCAIAAAGRAPSALVQVADPRDLSWRGRANVYGSIAPFLSTPPAASRRETVADYDAWARGGSEPRELGSRAADGPVWDAADPMLALTQERDNPTRVFLLAGGVEPADAGARQGPFGSNLRNVRLARRPRPSRPAELAMSRPEAASKTEVRPSTRPAALARPDRPRERLRPPDEGTTTPEEPTAPMPASDPMSLPSMPPMSTAGDAGAEMEPDEEPLASPMPSPSAPRPAPEASREGTSKAAAGPAPAPSTRPPAAREAAAPPDEDIIRGAEQFLAVLRHLGDRGGTLRLGAGADLELPSVSVEVAAGRRLEVVAESDVARPRLRFRPGPEAVGSPADWSAPLALRSGSLRLKGLDLIVPEPEGRPVDRLAAVAVRPGTELTLEGCTITLSARAATAAALAVQPAPPARGAGVRPVEAEPAAAVVAVRDGFVRSGGDAVIVAGGGRLDLRLEDVMVATEGSLLHALGSARPPGESAGRPALDVRMDRVTARVKGGLVHLQTTREEPEMAAVDIRADRSILSTVTGDHPLFRLEGQDQLERLRDRIRWEGHGVAYHHIKTYRRDEIVEAGGLPRIYDRDDWTRAFLPRDESPMLADLRFLQQADATVPAWRVVRDDLTPAAGGPSAPLGPDVEKVPEPPSPDEEP